MPHDLFEWLGRIKAVEREHSVVQFATEGLFASARKDSGVLEGKFTFRDIGHASEHLDATYIVRLFAEFETGLRLFWIVARASEPPSRTKDLLDGVAATRRIPHEQLTNAHVAREYR